MDLRELAAALVRGWRWLLGAMALSLGIALAYIMLATPIYRSETTLFIDPRIGSGLNSDIAAYRMAAETGLIDSQVKLISSDAVLRRVVEREKLATDPEFAGGSEGPEAVDKSIRSLAERLVVLRSERTFVVEIAVGSAEPRKAARLSDAVAQAFIDDQIDAKVSMSRSEGQWLKERIAEFQARILDAEKRVEVFKDMNRIVGANGKLMNEQQLSDVNTQLALARIRTAEAKAKADQVQEIVASGREPDGIPEVQRSGTIERLRTQYAESARDLANLRQSMGPLHPAIKSGEQQLAETRRLITQEIRRIAEATKNEWKVAQANEEAVQKRANTLTRETGDTNQSLVRLRELEREVEANRSTYERFLRSNGAVAQEGVDTPSARIVAPAAVPIRPTSPRRLPILMIAAVAGLGLGISGALLSGTRRRPAFIKSEMPVILPAEPLPSDPLPPAPPPASPSPPRRENLPATDPAALDRVRFVPRFDMPSPSRAEGASRQAFDALGLEYAEFIILLRQAVEAARRPGERLVVLVTSADAATGKTTVSTSLALSYARAGRQILLVDAHWRSPNLSRMLARDASAVLARVAGIRRPILGFAERWDENVRLLPLGEAGEIEAFASALHHGRSLTGADTIIVDTADLASDEQAELLLGQATVTVLLAPIAGDSSPHFAVAVIRERRQAGDMQGDELQGDDLRVENLRVETLRDLQAAMRVPA